MPSLRARLVELALPLLGIKRFFSEPDKLDERIAKLRRQAPIRPRAKWHRRFEITEVTTRGFPLVTISPKGGARPGAPHLLYLHGGGYVMDIAAVHWDTVCRLCEDLGASASVPIYPLAPEVKATQTLAAMRNLYDELVQQYGASSITVMGDSAGGGMTLALAQAIANDGGELPASLVLYSPWLDATASGEGQKAIEPKDRMLAIIGLEACGNLYAGDLPLDDHRLSPLFGPLKGLPPMAIFAGTHDILVVDARRLAEKLESPGMPDHRYHEYKNMFHVWMLLPIPEGRQTLEETVRFIREKHEEMTQ
ncbi:alpha/beta hydrolase [Qipengyuania vesicularis]|uniref:alpha/beta hydrolase n=1 Tax=Qipengyuania vesicularis TaxID=2867232 RepID=UPI001C889278|nr:alpha/beta hydrolase [Qipengyuania vesicularis]MBX7528564.1 alpha/beta hydrolase [Qipengyuania vesicularis]